jgi:hypothetical protein
LRIMNLNSDHMGNEAFQTLLSREGDGQTFVHRLDEKMGVTRRRLARLLHSWSMI